MNSRYQSDVKNIYTADYVNSFRSLHGSKSFVSLKHRLNRDNIRRLLNKEDKWLDACCGEAWHFTTIPKDFAKCVGVDISPAQIKLAKKENPDCKFFCSDILDADFPKNHFNLVTHFWGGYCYFNTYDQINSFFEKLINWTAIGGNLYIEILTMDLIETFNGSEYSKATASDVLLEQDDLERWTYRDAGGVHKMLSPSFEKVFKIFEGKFKDFSWLENTNQFIALSKLESLA